MKQIIAITCVILAVSSCKDSKATDETITDPASSSVAAADVALPYALEKPYRNWQIGSTENVAVAMSSLKAFSDKDAAALNATLGDSLEISLDNYHEKLSRDSAVAVLMAARAEMKDFTVTMYDYESVISADKEEEWVTFWYKQVWTDLKGKADSLNVIDDCKIKDGKMIELDEKIQHFPAKK